MIRLASLASTSSRKAPMSSRWRQICVRLWLCRFCAVASTAADSLSCGATSITTRMTSPHCLVIWRSKISVPVLAMNGDADQVVPHDTSGPRAVKLVKNGTLKTYPGYPHGMLTTHADVLNPDLLAFIQS
jgi:pimeloyl-ACP methyl ester carboxylesterase